MQATLPIGLQTKMLKDLSDGETVYAVPWAISVDSYRKLWLDGFYTYNYAPSGTVAMKVTKKDGGYYCDISSLTYYRWDCCGGTYSEDDRYIPVKELTGY